MKKKLRTKNNMKTAQTHSHWLTHTYQHKLVFLIGLKHLVKGVQLSRHPALHAPGQENKWTNLTIPKAALLFNSFTTDGPKGSTGGLLFWGSHHSCRILPVTLSARLRTFVHQWRAVLKCDAQIWDCYIFLTHNIFSLMHKFWGCEQQKSVGRAECCHFRWHSSSKHKNSHWCDSDTPAKNLAKNLPDTQLLTFAHVAEENWKLKKKKRNLSIKSKMSDECSHVGSS